MPKRFPGGKAAVLLTAICFLCACRTPDPEEDRVSLPNAQQEEQQNTQGEQAEMKEKEERIAEAIRQETSKIEETVSASASFFGRAGGAGGADASGADRQNRGSDSVQIYGVSAGGIRNDREDYIFYQRLFWGRRGDHQKRERLSALRLQQGQAL